MYVHIDLSAMKGNRLHAMSVHSFNLMYTGKMALLMLIQATKKNVALRKHVCLMKSRIIVI